MSNFYDESSVLSEYLLFHYGTEHEILPWSFGPVNSLNFPKIIVDKSADLPSSKQRALDIGCAVGRSSFELSKTFDSVLGIDYSHPFIDIASKIQSDGQITYSFKKQGDQRVETVAKIPEGSVPEKIQFKQGDAMTLHQNIDGHFDYILASNIICRLPEPSVFLSSVHRYLTSNGVFVLSTPYSYLEEFTSKEHWLGGLQTSDTAKDSACNLLKQKLSLIQEMDLPMLIREHERKFQWTVCHVTVWKR